MSPVLQVRDLSVSMRGGGGTSVPVLENLTFDVGAGQTIALVGESGCGKSITALALMRLLPGGFEVTSGSVFLDGEDILKYSSKRMRGIRGNLMSMIFQEPMSALNPVYTVGDQLSEVLRLHRGMSSRDALQEAVGLLRAVQIPAPEKRVKAYPHELSGGMRQRVMIAMALACKPKLIIADEPTTALDVTVQAQIFDLLARLQSETDTAIVLITHDLGVVSELANKTAVLYAGRCVENGSTAEIVRLPLHPYTKGLLSCVPHLSLGNASNREWQDLPEIPGVVPGLGMRGIECAFLKRCAFATEICSSRPQPPLADREVAGHLVSCWRQGELPI